MILRPLQRFFRETLPHMPVWMLGAVGTVSVATSAGFILAASGPSWTETLWMYSLSLTLFAMPTMLALFLARPRDLPPVAIGRWALVTAAVLAPLVCLRIFSPDWTTAPLTILAAAFVAAGVRYGLGYGPKRTALVAVTLVATGIIWSFAFVPL